VRFLSGAHRAGASFLHALLYPLPCRRTGRAELAEALRDLGDDFAGVGIDDVDRDLDSRGIRAPNCPWLASQSPPPEQNS
jgi:hypothetical protein